jgi:energy-coupling factor transporter ATP-binding protein EcfA2
LSRYSIAVKDFRIIKSAKVEPEGITLIYGPNGSGKSTLGKALVSLLSNQHSEDNFRHGQSSYAVAVRAGDNRLVYTRNGDVATLKFNDEQERQKLGRAPMSQVEPRFPLKRYDYEDDSFFPNFSFQNAVPIFGDISIYSLFSSMFSSIGRVSERVSACQTDCRALVKERDGSLANSEMLKEKVTESTVALDNLKGQYPDIDSEYLVIKDLVLVKQKIDEFMQEYLLLSNLCVDKEKRSMAALYDEAQPLFPAVMLVEKVNRVLSQQSSLERKLLGVRGELAALPDMPVGGDFYSLVSAGARLQRFQWGVQKMREESVPNVPVALLDGVGRLRSMAQGLEVIRESLPPVAQVSLIQGVSAVKRDCKGLDALREQMDFLEAEEAVVREQLQTLPCERYAEGLCPYSEVKDLRG